MRCDQVRYQLRSLAPGEIGSVARWAVRRHLDRCSGCSALHAELRRLEAQVRAWKDEKAPSTLYSRVRAEIAAGSQTALRYPGIETGRCGAAVAAPSRTTVPKTRLKVRRALLTAPFAFVGLFLSMGMLSNAQLRRSGVAITDARSAHMVSWRIEPDGKRVREGEIWYQDGDWRLAGGWYPIQIFRGGKLYRFDPQSERVTVKKAAGPFGHNPSGFSLTAMQRDMPGIGWQIGAICYTFLKGRLVRRVTTYGPPLTTHLERQIIWIDPGSDLPIRAESQVKPVGADALRTWLAPWKTVGEMEFSFNAALPAALFDPGALSRTATFYDLHQGYRTWKERLSRGIDRRTAGDRTVVIRDIQRNARGDIFILYSTRVRVTKAIRRLSAIGRPIYDEAGPGPAKIGLRDEAGTVYIQAPFKATDLHERGSGSTRPFVFDGQPLEGCWWVPLVPQPTGGPHRFTLTFAFPPVRPGSGTEPEKAGKPLRIAFSLHQIERPTVRLIPEWMPFMVDDGLLPRDLPVYRAQARAAFSRKRGDHRRAAQYFAELVGAIESYKRETGMSKHPRINESQVWYSFGDELAALGQTASAATAFRQAVTLADWPEDRHPAQERLDQLQALRSQR